MSRKAKAATPGSDKRVDRGIYRRVRRDGTLGAYRALGPDGKRSFDTLEEARAWRDAERAVPAAVRSELKSDLPIDAVLLRTVMLYLEQHDRLAASTLNGYRKTVTYALEPWLRRHRWTTRTLTTAQLQAWCDDGTVKRPGQVGGSRS